MNNFQDKTLSYLGEGIVFFKDSKRLVKLANKIKLAEDEDHTISTKVMGLASLMNELERDYRRAGFEKHGGLKPSVGTREEIEEKYAKLEEKYYTLIKMINKESTFKFLKTSGIITLITAAFFASYNFMVTSPIMARAVIETGIETKTGKELSEPSKAMIKNTVEKNKGDYTRMFRGAANEIRNNPAVEAAVNNALNTDVARDLDTGANALSVAGAAAGAATAVGTGVSIAVLSKIVKVFRKVSGAKRVKNAKIYNATKEFLDKVEGIV